MILSSPTRRGLLVAGLAASLTGCGASGGGLPPTAIGPRSASVAQPISSKIRHVVVVILENRSFDDIFAADPALANTRNGPVDVDSGLTAESAGQPTTLVPASLSMSTFDVDHSHPGFLADYDGGVNDGWPTAAYGYVPQGEIQPYYDMASEFSISDRFFHGITAPTFPSHLEIGAASTFGIIGNPNDEVWGCDSAPGTVTGLYDPNAPGQIDPTGGPFPCFDDLSIFDLLDRAGITWRYYVQPEGYDVTGQLNIAAYFRHIRYGPDWNVDIAKSDAQFLTDVTTNSLPQVSFVIPNDTSTDHAGTPSLGPTYIKQLVNTFGSSSYFDDTLVIITWDDWGGWYDHVVPPQRADGSQLSYRKPVLFIGGYVKRNYVSHVQTEDASIPKTIEEIYGLGSLGRDDVAANPFDDVVDVTTSPAPFAMITSNQGDYVSNPVAPVTFGGDRGSVRAEARDFRLIPAGFMRYQGRGRYGSPENDYYGERSRDY